LTQFTVLLSFLFKNGTDDELLTRIALARHSEVTLPIINIFKASLRC